MMSPEAKASLEAYKAYEKAQETMRREDASQLFLVVYRQEMAKAVPA